MYSPEVFQAQQELLAMGAWGGAPRGRAAGAADRRGEQRKLELLGVGTATIDRIVAGGQPVAGHPACRAPSTAT